MKKVITSLSILLITVSCNNYRSNKMSGDGKFTFKKVLVPILLSQLTLANFKKNDYNLTNNEFGLKSDISNNFLDSSCQLYHDCIQNNYTFLEDIYKCEKTFLTSIYD